MIYCSFYLDQHATWCQMIVVLVSSLPLPPNPLPSIGFSCEIMIVF
jgi:hypothetical protein